MKNEEELNTCLKSSLTVGIKIPDPSSQFNMTVRRPFDLFGVFRGLPIYIEAKFQKTISSFNLSRIADHQLENLLAFKKAMPCSLCWIVLGINVDKGDNRIYIFNDIFEIEERRKNKNNISKKELEVLPYLLIKKGLVDFTNYEE